LVLFLWFLVVFGPQKLPGLAGAWASHGRVPQSLHETLERPFEEEIAREMERADMQAERKKAAEAAATALL